MQYSEILNEAKKDRMFYAVQKASELFTENGIENVKMTDIANTCDIGVASLYRYFGNKTEIVIKTGILQWKNISKLFNGVFDCEYFENKTGIEQIRDLLKVQMVLFRSHKNFIKFLYEFDNYVIREKVSKDSLKEYEQSIMNIYPFFEKAFIKGKKDKSVKSTVDFNLFYVSISHSIITLCEKFIKGEILPSDHFNKAEEEIELMIDIAVKYLKND